MRVEGGSGVGGWLFLRRKVKVSKACAAVSFYKAKVPYHRYQVSATMLLSQRTIGPIDYPGVVLV